MSILCIFFEEKKRALDAGSSPVAFSFLSFLKKKMAKYINTKQEDLRILCFSLQSHKFPWLTNVYLNSFPFQASNPSLKKEHKCTHKYVEVVFNITLSRKCIVIIYEKLCYKPAVGHDRIVASCSFFQSNNKHGERK